MATMQFAFADVPLLIEREFEAGLLNGEAEISYDGEGRWSIIGITLDGVRNHKWEQVVVDDGPLYSMISDRLYEQRERAIQAAVRERVGSRPVRQTVMHDWQQDFRKNGERV